jgi:hypothetical protein
MEQLLWPILTPLRNWAQHSPAQWISCGYRAGLERGNSPTRSVVRVIYAGKHGDKQRQQPRPQEHTNTNEPQSRHALLSYPAAM